MYHRETSVSACVVYPKSVDWCLSNNTFVCFVMLQHQDSLVPSGQQYVSFEYKPGMDVERTASSSDHESPWVLSLTLFFISAGMLNFICRQLTCLGCFISYHLGVQLSPIPSQRVNLTCLEDCGLYYGKGSSGLRIMIMK